MLVSNLVTCDVIIALLWRTAVLQHNNNNNVYLFLTRLVLHSHSVLTSQKNCF